MLDFISKSLTLLMNTLSTGMGGAPIKNPSLPTNVWKGLLPTPWKTGLGIKNNNLGLIDNKVD